MEKDPEVIETKGIAKEAQAEETAKETNQ